MSKLVLVRYGKEIIEQRMSEIASNFTDFAILSSNIYCTNQFDSNFIDLKGWKQLELNLVPKIPNPPLKSQKLITGLKYEVWQKVNGPKCQVVIVFKGTTPSLLSDWICNFRWITLNPVLKSIFRKFVWDYYHQVQVLTPLIIEQVRKILGNTDIEFVSTGHSLGGGLAQQAAYSCNEIKKVVVFNSTPVTGYKDIIKNVRIVNHIGIEISRVYHSGEVLSYLRDFIRVFILPLSMSNPCIKEYQFTFMKGSILKKHNIREFALSLNEKATSL